MSALKMLAIDLGASSGRGIVGKFDGEKLTLEENHRFPNEPVMINGCFRWDIQRIFHEIKNAIRKCALSEDKDIQSIAIDTWGVDYGLLDKRGQLLANPFNYRDLRTESIVANLDPALRSSLYDITGIQTITINTLFQLMADVRDNPELLALADSMLFTPDLLGYFLTGIKETEYTIASTSDMLDAKARNWAYDTIRSLGIPTEILGKIVKPGTVLGDLLPEVREDVGGITAKVVHTASHDTASAVVAVPAKGKDYVYISSGTWSLMGCELDDPCMNAIAKKYDFANEGGVGGRIRFLKNIMGLWLEQESRRQWKREGKEFSFDDLSNAALASKPLRCLIDPSDQIFAAPGNMPKRIADYCEKTGQYVPQTEGEIVRCIFDSLALRYRWTVEKLNEVKGTAAQFINIVGGGVKEPPLCQFTSDACGIPVYAGPVEATAIGNLAVQAMAAGEIKDTDEARHVVRNSFDIKLYEPKTADKDQWDEGYARFLKLIGE